MTSRVVTEVKHWQGMWLSCERSTNSWWRFSSNIKQTPSPDTRVLITYNRGSHLLKCIFRRTNVFKRWQITQSSRAISSKVKSSNHLICKSAKIFHKNDMQYVALFRTALNNGLVEGYLIDPSKPWCNPFAISEPSFTKKVECLFFFNVL